MFVCAIVHASFSQCQFESQRGAVRQRAVVGLQQALKPSRSEARAPPPPRNEHLGAQAQTGCARSAGGDGARGSSAVSCCGGVV